MSYTTIVLYHCAYICIVVRGEIIAAAFNYLSIYG